MVTPKPCTLESEVIAMHRQKNICEAEAKRGVAAEADPTPAMGSESELHRIYIWRCFSSTLSCKYLSPSNFNLKAWSLTLNWIVSTRWPWSKWQQIYQPPWWNNLTGIVCNLELMKSMSARWNSLDPDSAACNCGNNCRN